MPSTTLTRGNVLYTVLLTASLAPVAVAANSTVEQTVTVPGVQIGDQVSAMSAQFAYSANVDWINFRVTAVNAVIIAFQNNTGASVTPPAGVYLFEINRPEAPGVLPTTAA